LIRTKEGEEEEEEKQQMTKRKRKEKKPFLFRNDGHTPELKLKY